MHLKRNGRGLKLDTGTIKCGIWSDNKTKKHINYLELFASQLTVFSLLRDRSSILVRSRCDNSPAVTNVNEIGGCRYVILVVQQLGVGHLPRECDCWQRTLLELPILMLINCSKIQT